MSFAPFEPPDGRVDTLCWLGSKLEFVAHLQLSPSCHQAGLPATLDALTAAADARTKALELKRAAAGESDPTRRVHFVVALQHGRTLRSADGTFTRVPVLNADGSKLKGYKFLAFNVETLARYLEHLRLHRPSCMNLFEEVNAARGAARPFGLRPVSDAFLD